MSEALLHPSVPSAALMAVLGYAVVFFGILLLLVVVIVMGKIMVSSQKKAAAAGFVWPDLSSAAAAAAAPAPEAAPADKPVAKGTAGELMLHDVDPKDAAMVMAIVAHKLNKPLNELRFRSIKEVKDK